MPKKGSTWSEAQREKYNHTMAEKERVKHIGDAPTEQEEQEWSFDFDIRDDYE
jgi:hypothetical protein